jgi:molybdopterin-containing oxidoreductase family iron-sulfur binding subunit
VKRPFGRRTFLRWIGAAGLASGCSPKGPIGQLVPHLTPPIDAVPGTPLHYRTTCRACPAGCGVTATSREGRVIKLEGNPEEPIGKGALCARGQAEVQGLHHPARLRGPQRRVGGALAPLAWGEAEAMLAEALGRAMARGSRRVRLLTRMEPGSAGRAQRAFLRAVGAVEADRVVLEPLDPAPLRAAAAALFGRRELPVLELGRARTVAAFGADLLETWGSPVEQTRQLAAGRGRVGPERTRLTWVGPRLSLTGVAADRWIRARSGGELAVALGVLRVLVEARGGARGLGPEATLLAGPVAALDPAALAARAGVPWRDVEALGLELLERRPSALVGPGPAAQGEEATRLAGVLLLCNLVLGNFSSTVRFGLDAGEDLPSTGAELEALVADLGAGRVDVLLVHHADLVGALPAALGGAAALDRVPLVVSFAGRPDGTSPYAHLLLPDHHPLESFGDVAPRRGVFNTLQPAMAPLHDTRAASQVLLEVAARLPAPAAHVGAGGFADLVAARLGAALGAAPGGDEARAAQQRGGVWTPAPPLQPTLLRGAAGPFLIPPAPASARAEGWLDLLPFPTALRAGGDLPWLRETPDALSTVSWSPWLELSPATASRLGVATGQLVEVSSPAGSAELPVYVFPGLRDDTAALPLGGPEALALLPWRTEPSSAAPLLTGTVVTVRATGRPGALPLLEGSPYQHGRAIVPSVSAASPAVPRPARSRTLHEGPVQPAEHRWAMAIDLDRCTGCQACVVACAAENNVPVMGAQAAREGRAMSWLRLERYLGETPGGALDVRLLPVLCQQCGSAPCEPVCPVYATYHTAEGLNAQVYNRCVGTRFCSNNCPYKARTFNWREAVFEPEAALQLNPEVAVRSRGVMEKCTFCVQRIRAAEGRARGQGRSVADGEIVPACAQTCPAQAIVFGDALDPAAHVSRLAVDPRGFGLLEALGTRPAITYLAPVRERGDP